jgi:hypothetical protein
MKTILLAAAAAVVLAAPAATAHEPMRKDRPAVSNADEISAASRKYRRYYSQRGYRAYGAADPSFDRYGRPYRPTVSGPCMIDLGYGRFARCDGSL